MILLMLIECNRLAVTAGGLLNPKLVIDRLLNRLFLAGVETVVAVLTLLDDHNGLDLVVVVAAGAVDLRGGNADVEVVVFMVGFD